MGRARTFGDLNCYNSAVSKLKASEKAETWHPDYGTKAEVYFIAPNKEVFKIDDGLINQQEV